MHAEEVVGDVVPFERIAKLRIEPKAPFNFVKPIDLVLLIA